MGTRNNLRKFTGLGCCRFRRLGNERCVGGNRRHWCYIYWRRPFSTNHWRKCKSYAATCPWTLRIVLCPNRQRFSFFQSISFSGLLLISKINLLFNSKFARQSKKLWWEDCSFCNLLLRKFFTYSKNTHSRYVFCKSRKLIAQQTLWYLRWRKRFESWRPWILLWTRCQENFSSAFAPSPLNRVFVFLL